MSIILSTPVILALTAVAIICIVAARYVKHVAVSTALSLIGFFIVVANIVYALLLGAKLNEILTYVLIFVLIGVTAFLNNGNCQSSNEDNVHSINTDVDKDGGKNIGGGDNEL